MAEPTIALVFSPEPWVEGLHRHCTDHGGARIRQVVVDPRVALDEVYDTLVVSHRWPALTPALIDALHDRGRRVLGVFDMTEPASHEHLSRVGVDAMVVADATMQTMVEAIVALGTSAADTLQGSDAIGITRDLGRVIAVGGTSGAGATELSIELARCFARSGFRTVVTDVDDSVPAVVPRLGLPVEPNLRTAIDGAVYDRGSVCVSAVHCADGDFDVLGGLPSAAAWAQVRPEEVLLVLEQLAEAHEVIVANIGSHLEPVGEPGRDRFGISRAVAGVADAVVGVTAPSPVGVVRAVTWAAEIRRLARACRLHMVVNRAPRDGFRRSELVIELARSVDAESFDLVPDDRRVVDAGWAGAVVERGPFTRAVEALGRRLAVDHRCRPSEVLVSER